MKGVYCLSLPKLNDYTSQAYCQSIDPIECKIVGDRKVLCH